MKDFNFGIVVGSRTKDGLLVRFQFRDKIQIVARLKSYWQVNYFNLGAADEGLRLTPEGSSEYELYRYLTNQVQKIYNVYEMVSEFPLGLLLILVYFHSIMLCNERCPQCELFFDLSGAGFGLMPW